MELTEPVLAAMRVIRGKSDAYLATAHRLQAPYGAIPAGNEHHRAFVRGESLAVFLRELQRGTVAEAVQVAKAFARESIAIGNAKRGKDYQTYIADMAADADIDYAAQCIRNATSKVLKTQQIELLTNPSVNEIICSWQT
jgi:hypothetical protein